MLAAFSTSGVGRARGFDDLAPHNMHGDLVHTSATTPRSCSIQDDGGIAGAF